MLTVVNNTTMRPVATVKTKALALAWAETVSRRHDFSVLAHKAADLKPYTLSELRRLHAALTDTVKRPLRQTLTHDELTELVLGALREHGITSELPPDGKRVAPLTNDDEETTMATTKKTSSKKATTKKAPRKVAAKKAPAVKKVAAKKAPAAEGKRTRYAGLTITPVKKEHGAREGTKRARAMDILLASKTTDEAIPQLLEIGADTSFIRFAVETGIITVA